MQLILYSEINFNGLTPKNLLKYRISNCFETQLSAHSSSSETAAVECVRIYLSAILRESGYAFLGVAVQSILSSVFSERTERNEQNSKTAALFSKYLFNENNFIIYSALSIKKEISLF